MGRVEININQPLSCFKKAAKSGRTRKSEEVHEKETMATMKEAITWKIMKKRVGGKSNKERGLDTSELTCHSSLLIHN